MNKYEQLIEHIINDEEAKARALFHEIVVEKSRDIYESLMDEEGMQEAVDQEGPADLLAAVEQEINNPGRSVDNLTDVLNATFGSDRSPEFKKARAVISKYIDLVDNAAMGSEQDGIAPMSGGNIATTHWRDTILFTAHCCIIDQINILANYSTSFFKFRRTIATKSSIQDICQVVNTSPWVIDFLFNRSQ